MPAKKERPLTAAERQRRRRAKLRDKPWLDPLKVHAALIAALRGEAACGRLPPERAAELAQACVAAMGVAEDERAEAEAHVVELITKAETAEALGAEAGLVLDAGRPLEGILRDGEPHA